MFLYAVFELFVYLMYFIVCIVVLKDKCDPSCPIIFSLKLLYVCTPWAIKKKPT